MKLQDAVAEYLTAARQAGRSRTTILQYGWHLDRLVRWLAGQDIVCLTDVDRSSLRRWGAELHDGWSPATIKQAVSAARSFLRWCGEEGWIEPELGQVLRVPRVPVRVQRTLTVGEVRAVLDACDDSVIGLRNQALVSLLVDAGLRASEICRLCVGDLNLREGILVVQVKGGDQQHGFFGEVTGRRLQAWLAVRPAEPGVDAVFVAVGGSSPGKPLTRDGLRVILRRLGRRAGVEGVCAHAFRRSFACISVQAGASSRLVQLAGRWSNIQMVERYTQSMRALEAGEIYRSRYSSADWLEHDR
jgi:site-specific recombinase XerD